MARFDESDYQWIESPPSQFALALEDLAERPILELELFIETVSTNPKFRKERE